MSPGPGESILDAVLRTIDALNERNITDNWLPDNELKAWHYMAGTLTAFLPAGARDGLVAAVEGLVARAQGTAACDACGSRDPHSHEPEPLFTSVRSLQYDAEADELLDEEGNPL
jgi:hypothetical protein